MKNTKFKQCACISEASADAFQDAANAILAQIPEPIIEMDKTKPFTMYVFYNVQRDTPETVLELLEMLDHDGGNAHCENCPAYEPPTDKRRKWGRCRQKNEKTRGDARACEIYYIGRRKGKIDLYEEYKQIPYTIGR